MDDREALREQYLAALDAEVATARQRLSEIRKRSGDLSHRAEAVAAIADVNIDWLQAERDRVRAGGDFDEEVARHMLGEGAP